MSATLVAVISCVCTLAGTLVTIGLSVGKPLIENTKKMVVLTDAVAALTAQMEKFENNNHDAHKRIHEKLEADEKQISDHEVRLSILEHKGGKSND